MTMRLLRVVHQCAYLAYPREFRAHFGGELSEIFMRRVETARQRNPAVAAALGLWLCADAVVTGVAMRFERRPYQSSPQRKAPMSLDTLAGDWPEHWRRLVSRAT